VSNLPIETPSRRQMLNQVGRRNKGKGAGAHLASLAGSIMVRVLDNDGCHLYSFGDGLFGELGNSKVAIQHTPECVCFNEIKVRVKHKAREKPNERQTFKSELHRVNVLRYIACGDNHTAVVQQDGTLFTFGNNVHGQLGKSTTALVLVIVSTSNKQTKHTNKQTRVPFHTSTLRSP
jgi:alpha-tubulin suppressor-like RCC1 family protein